MLLRNSHNPQHCLPKCKHDRDYDNKNNGTNVNFCNLMCIMNLTNTRIVFREKNSAWVVEDRKMWHKIEDTNVKYTEDGDITQLSLKSELISNFILLHSNVNLVDTKLGSKKTTWCFVNTWNDFDFIYIFLSNFWISC